MVEQTENKVIKEIKETRKIFNELRNNFSREEIKDVRGKLYKKESVYKHLKEIEQKKRLIEKKKKVLERIEEYFQKLKEDLSKLKRHRDNIIHDTEYKGINEIQYLFNNIDEEDCYEPIKTVQAFDDNYIKCESRGDRDSKLSLCDYLNIIRPYLRDMIDYNKALGEWKIQLIMRIIFLSSLDANEIHIMHTRSDNIEFMSGTETDEVITELFNSFLRRYQEGLETKMKGSSYIFERVDLLEYDLHKISLNRGGSYIVAPELLRNKKAVINLKNKGDDCLKYAIVAALNYDKINNHPEKPSKIKAYEKEEVCHICKEKFCNDEIIKKNFKKSKKVRDHCHYTGKYRGAAHSICNLHYKIPKEIPLVFHNGSTYDYHFIIKQLAKEFKSNFDCLGENTEKYITFSVPIKKEDDDDSNKIITYKLKSIDSYRFMSDLLSNLVDNLSEINKKEPENEFIDSMRSMVASLLSLVDNLSKINKEEQAKFIDSMRSMSALLSGLIDDVSKINKKEETSEFTDSMRSMSASLSGLIDDVSEINKKRTNEFIDSMRSMLVSLSSLIDELSEINKKISLAALIEKFSNQLCNKDLDKSALVLRKGVYPYEYMDSWKRFNETSN